MHDDGKIFAITESNPPHIHITSRINTDKNWNPPYSR